MIIKNTEVTVRSIDKDFNDGEIRIRIRYIDHLTGDSVERTESFSESDASSVMQPVTVDSTQSFNAFARGIAEALLVSRYGN